MRSMPCWMWIGCVLALLAGVALFDSLVRHQQGPLVDVSVSDPLSGIVIRYTKLGMDRERLMSIIEDPGASPLERQKAVAKLAGFLDEAGRYGEKIDLLRQAIELLGDQVDIGKQAETLFDYYAGKPSGKEEGPGRRDEDGLQWVFTRRRANLEVLYREKPERLAASFSKLAKRVADLQLREEALSLLEDVLIYSPGIGKSRDVLLAVDEIVSKSTDDEFVVQLQAFWEKMLDMAGTYENISDLFFNVPGKWYRLGEKERNERLRARSLQLLDKARQVAGVNISMEVLSVIFDIYTREGDGARLELLESEFLAYLEEENFKTVPNPVSFGILKAIYKKRGHGKKLNALAKREKLFQAAKKRLEPLKGKIDVISKAFESGTPDRGVSLFEEFHLSLLLSDSTLPEIQALKLIAGLRLIGRGEFERGEVFLAEVENDLPVSAFGVQAGTLAALYLDAYVAVRDARKLDLARKYLKCAHSLLRESWVYLPWIETELWFLDGAKGDCPTELYSVQYVPDAGITIDGRSDEAAYREARPITTFYNRIGEVVTETTRFSEVATEVRLIHDGRWLYIYALAMEPDLDGCTIKNTERDSSVWDDDCIEFFTAGERNLRTYNQWSFNRIGAVVDLKRRNCNVCPNGNILAGVTGGQIDIEEFDTGAEAAGQILASGWAVEVRIPLADITGLSEPFRGAIFPADIRRLRHGRGYDITVQGWSKSDGSTHSTSLFKLVRLK